MYQTATLAKNSKPNKKTIADPVSIFNPSAEVREITRLVQRDMQTGRNILTTPYIEYNRKSIIDEINDNQKKFNSYIPPKSDDPDESWRAQTVRPVTRNKIISIAAHVTAQIMYPNVFAQNTEDNEDKEAATTMRDLVEWVIDNSNYSMTFIQSVIAALTDPVTIVHTEFLDVKRRVKEMKDDGTYTVKEIVDEIFSGFTFNLVQANEFYIANVYEKDVQKQRFVARRKLMDFDEAQMIWGSHKNFKYIRPGTRQVFDMDTNTFYDQSDVDLSENLVEVVWYFHHAKDLQLTFINGVIMCDTEYPIQRIDKKYPFAKMIFEMIRNGEFFYGKSAANKLSSDQELIDTMYNMVMDGTFMSLIPPMALYGTEDINSSVMVPGTVSSFKDPNTKLESIGPRSDLRAGLEAIGLIERSMSESSQDNSRQGLSTGGEKTAYEIETLQKNAQIALGLFGKMVGFFVDELGGLMLSDICQHLTVAQGADIVGNGTRIKYMNFMLPDKIEGGTKVNKKIEFTDEYLGKDEMEEGELMDESFKVMKNEGGFDSNMRIYKVNPELFRNLKYKIRQSPDLLEVPNKMLEKALNLEAYDRAIQNPLVDQEAVTREFFLEVYKPGESDRFIKKVDPMMAQQQEGGEGLQQKGVNTNLTSQITGGTSLKNLLK